MADEHTSSANYTTSSNHAQGQQFQGQGSQQHQQWCNSSGYQGLHSYNVAGHHQSQADFTADGSELSFGSFQESSIIYPVSQEQQQQRQHFYPQAHSHVTESPHFHPLPAHGPMHHTTHSSQHLPLTTSDHHAHSLNQSMTNQQQLRTPSFSAIQGDTYHLPSRVDEAVLIEPRSLPVLTQYEGSFMSKVQKFVVKHGEVFNTLTQDHSPTTCTLVETPTLHNHSSYSEESYKYAEPDALEYHMQVDSALRKKRFLELVSVGDVMRGSIVHKTHGELSVHVTSFVSSHKLRELTDIGIKGVLPLENLSSTVEKRDDIMKDMQLNDVIQVLVVCQQEEGNLLLSFREDHVVCCDGRLPEGTKLGYLEGRKADIQRTGKVQADDYLQQLEDDPGFTNPSCAENLKAILGIEITGTKPLGPGMRPTLLKDIQMADYPDSDYCHALRKAQRNKWSMDTVALGVNHIKGGNHSKAMELLDHALQIDAENVEGLVARGALYANLGKYKQGIADFESALTLKHTHKNARRYLVQTQVAYGEMLEKGGKLQQAMRCYREALADDPQEETAKKRLGLLTAALEKQAADRKEQERQKAEEKAKLKKLYKIIEEEKEKKIRKFNKMIKQSTRRRRKSSKSSKKHKTRSSKSKTKRKSSRHYSSSSALDDSDDSTLSASSQYSRSRSRSKSRSRSRSHSPVSKSTKRSRKKSLPRSPSRSTSRSLSPMDRQRKTKSKHSHVRSRSRSTSMDRERTKTKAKKSHRHSRSRSRSCSKPPEEKNKLSRSKK